MPLHRHLSAKHLWAIAVGMVISGQYFGWNFGFATGGLYGLILAALLVTIFYLCFMFSYAELATAIPHAGGPSAYAQTAFGPMMGYLSGIACLIEFTFAPPAIAVSIGSYLHFLLPFINPHIAAISAFIICITINLTGTHNVAKFETVVTLIALAGLILYYAYGLPQINWHHFMPGKQVLPHGVHGIFASIPFAIWLYLCIEGGAMAAEEVKDPCKDISKGFIVAIITLALCSLFTIVTTAGLEPQQHHVTDYPLPHALILAYPSKHWLPYVIDIVGLFGLFASLNGIIIGSSRQVFALAREGYLPRFLSQLSRQHVPYWALIIPGLFGIVCAGSADLSNSLIIVAVFGATVTYCISLSALFKLRHSHPHLKRPFKVLYPIIPAIALCIGLICLVAIVYYALLPNHLQLFDISINLVYVVLGLVFIALFLRKII